MLPGQSRNTPCCMEKKKKDTIKSLILEEGLSLGKAAAAIPLQSMGDVIRCNLHPAIEQSAAFFCLLGCTSGWRCPEGKGWPGRLRRWGWDGRQESAAAEPCGKLRPRTLLPWGSLRAREVTRSCRASLPRHQLDPFCITGFVLSASCGDVLGLRNAVGISVGTFHS